MEAGHFQTERAIGGFDDLAVVGEEKFGQDGAGGSTVVYEQDFWDIHTILVFLE